jgi:hypothetical protein
MPGVGIIQLSFLPNHLYLLRAIKSYTGIPDKWRYNNEAIQKPVEPIKSAGNLQRSSRSCEYFVVFNQYERIRIGGRKVIFEPRYFLHFHFEVKRR